MADDDLAAKRMQVTREAVDLIAGEPAETLCSAASAMRRFRNTSSARPAP